MANQDNFRRGGLWLSMATVLSVVGPAASDWSDQPGHFVPTICLGSLHGYWRVGLADMKQSSHAIRRNYPVLGNLRYILETVGLYSVEFGCHAMFVCLEGSAHRPFMYR
jgi:hypothetical protein